MICYYHVALATNKVKVITSFSILSDIVQNIAGDKVDVISLVGANQDVHEYELKPSDISKINNSQIFFINGMGLEAGFINQALLNYKGIKVNLTESLAIQLSPNKLDPHVWQDVLLVRDYYLPNITQALIQVLPQFKNYFQKNQLIYTNKLNNLDQWALKQIEHVPLKSRNAVTTHDAFSYLAKHYSLNFVTVQGVSTDSEATPLDIAKLEAIIRHSKIKYVFLENMTNNQLIKQIAKDTNVIVGPKLYSDALSNKDQEANTYISLFQYNINTLVNTWK
jgi:zinc/manganese transport system substrate-binding protein